MTRSKLLGSAAALALLPFQAVAQDAFLLDEIVISAEVGGSDAASTGTTVTVISEDELRATEEVRLVDALARVPGVNVITRGPIGTIAGLTIRGASQNYVRVLVDGIDVTDPSAPQIAYNFGLMNTADVSRIEILRGAQSALYGSEAMAGVINITTRRAEEIGQSHSLALEAGSYGTVRGSYGFTTRTDRYDLGLTLSHITTDGFSAVDENDGNTEADGFTGTRLSFSGSYILDNGARIGFSAFAEDSTGEYDENFPLEDGNPDEKAPSTSVGARVFAEISTGAVDHTVALSYFAIDRANRGTDGGTTVTENEGSRVQLSYVGTTGLGAGALSFGADLTRETYEEANDFFGFTSSASDDSTVAGVFAEYSFSPSEKLDVVATLRYDDHSEAGGAVTGRVATAWRAAPDLILRASAATGYRAPSLYEVVNSGSNDLEPEETRSLDLGIEKRFGDSAVRATLFYAETDNLIDYSFPEYFQLPGTVVRRGLELEGDFSLGDKTRLGVAYTFTDGDNPGISAGNTWNTQFPKHDLSLSLSAEITDRLSGVLTAQHVADRQTLPDYTVAHATLAYKVNDRVETWLRVENLFDEEYQLVEGYGTSDRAVYVGLRARF